MSEHEKPKNVKEKQTSEKEKKTLVALPGVDMEAIRGIKKSLEKQGFEVEMIKIEGKPQTVEEWREEERKKKKAAIEGLRTLFK